GLSSAAVETLAIVAYRQPISRVEVEEIRGVSSSSVLNTLRDWELIEVVGRGEGLGRPLLYGTTERFLDHFGFQSLDDLPVPEDLPVTLREEEPEDGEGEQAGSDADAGSAGGDGPGQEPAEAAGG
ncbi:MAG: SMC-Scp complex subunit ScpB, partial [Gemmatimonadota bacterium]